jgi:hypothetical protein
MRSYSVQDPQQLVVPIGLGGHAVIVAVFAVVLDHRLQDHRQHLGRVMPRDLAPFQVVQQVLGHLGFRFLGQLHQPAFGALVQDRPQVGQIQEPLGEQVRAVGLDEDHQPRPFARILDFLQHRQPQRLAVRQPAGQQGFGQLFQALDDGPRAGLLAAAGSPFGRPRRRGMHDHPDQRLVPHLEHLVEFRHRAGADGMLTFHFPSQFDDLAGLDNQAQTR